MPFCTPPHEQISYGFINRSTIASKSLLEKKKKKKKGKKKQSCKKAWTLMALPGSMCNSFNHESTNVLAHSCGNTHGSSPQAENCPAN